MNDDFWCPVCGQPRAICDGDQWCPEARRRSIVCFFTYWALPGKATIHITMSSHALTDISWWSNENIGQQIGKMKQKGM